MTHKALPCWMAIPIDWKRKNLERRSPLILLILFCTEKLGRCGRQNMLWPYIKIWDWDRIFGRAVKAISSLGVRSPCKIPSE
jgi:hypothetical protein